MDAALAELEFDIEQILETLGVPSLVVGGTMPALADLHVRYHNPPYREVFGAPPMGEAGSVEGLFGIRDAGAFLKALRLALSEARGVNTEVRFDRNGRTGCYGDLVISPVFGKNSDQMNFIARIWDKTDEKIAFSANAWFTHALDNTSDAIIGHSLDGVVTYWNATAASLYGWSREEAIGSNIADLLGIEQDAFDVASAELRAKGSWAGRMAHVARSGVAIPVFSEWNAVPAYEDVGEAIIQTNANLTQRLVLDDELTRASRLEAIGGMTGGIAHDFNNILTVILGSMDLAEARAKNDPEIARFLEMARDAATHGSKLVSQMLAFGRRQHLQPVEIDINEHIESMRDLIQQTMGESVRVDMHFAPDIWKIDVDQAQFESAIINLCLNARDSFDKSPQRLTIETSKELLDERLTDKFVSVEPGHYLVVAVTDNGCGIEEDKLPRVFEPFFTTKQDGGSGLGLSMVYGFLKQTGGTVTLYSEPGVGTTVRLYFPARRAGTSAAPIAREASREQIGTGTGTILLVEDNEMVRSNGRLLLESLGYEVIEARHADAALELLKSDQPIDILFTDIVMPGELDGIELGKRAAALRPDMAIVYTSGYSEQAISADAGSGEALKLTKPYRMETLASILRRAVARRNAAGGK